MDKWNVYKINDFEWYMGRSLEEAKAAAASDWGYATPDLVQRAEDDDMFDDPRELTDEEMDGLFVDSHEDDSPSSRRSFREELARRVADGPTPQLFARTES